MILAFKKKKRTRKEPRKWKLPQLPENWERDTFLFGGIAAMGFGVYQIYPPSAFVLVGGCFIALGLLIYMGGSDK